MNNLEKFFEEIFNESIRLQEIFIKKDFIDVIDKAIQKNKDSNPKRGLILKGSYVFKKTLSGFQVCFITNVIVRCPRCQFVSQLGTQIILYVRFF